MAGFVGYCLQARVRAPPPPPRLPPLPPRCRSTAPVCRFPADAPPPPPSPQSGGVHFVGAAGVFGGQEITFGDIAAAGGPADQWDALPTLAKLQVTARHCSLPRHCRHSHFHH